MEEEKSLQLAWLFNTTGSVRANAMMSCRNRSIVTSKSIEQFNIPRVCSFIQDPRIPLAKSSGLLYGTVLIYGRKCDSGLKEAVSVKLAIDKIKQLQQKNPNSKKQAETQDFWTKGLHIKTYKGTLIDDPAFDLDLGQKVVRLDDLIKEMDSNQGSALGLGMMDLSNWKGDHGLREASVSDFSDTSNEYVSFDRDDAGASVEDNVNMWRTELGFEFDGQGNTVDKNGNLVESQNMVSEEIGDQTITPEYFEDDDDEQFQFDSFDNAIEEDIEQVVEQQQQKKETKRAYRQKTRGIKRRKIIYDSDIYLSIHQMKASRDEFEAIQSNKRIQQHQLKSPSPQFNLLSIFKLFKRGATQDQQMDFELDIPNFRVDDQTIASISDVEQGRQAIPRTRSSSVSSVEYGRRANVSDVGADNSSMQIDFNIESSQHTQEHQYHRDAERYIDPSENIGFFLTELHNMFNVMGLTETSFEQLYPLDMKRAQAANGFHLLLHAASKSQIGLGLSNSVVGKSQWDVLLPEDVLVAI